MPNPAGRSTTVACRLAALAVLLTGAPLPAQSTLDSPPNLANWVAVAGGLQFNLLHRFSLGPAPSRKVQNAPTATLLYGLTSWLSAGFNYASASEVVQAYPNEWELLTRVALLSQDGGAPVDIQAQGGWNVATESVDGQLLLSRRVGPVRAVAGVGALQDALGSGRRRATVAAGATVRVRPLLGLTGDVSTFADREDADVLAWSAGVNVGVAGTPHTMSLHATNVASRTLQGIARGTSETRYGFEYTIPIPFGFGGGGAFAGAPPHHARLLGRHGAAPGRGVRAQAPKPVRIDIRSLQYTKRKLEVTVGTTVEWRNRDPLAHTVTSDSSTADSSRFDSGLIPADGTWRHTFTTPGTYTYHCAPHPHMTAVVIVRARESRD